MIDNTQSSEVEAKALTDWKNEPTIKDLKQDLQDAKPTHDAQMSKIREWLDYFNVEGVAKIKSEKGNSAIQPKLIRKQAEWRYPALSEPFLSTHDLFKVSPRTWEDREASIQNQILLNYQINTSIDKVNFIDDLVRTAVNEGTVVLRTGWEFKEEEYEEEAPVVEFVVNPEFQPTIEHILQMKKESPSEYYSDVPEELKEAVKISQEQGQAVEPRITGYELQKKSRTVVNRPTVEVCETSNVVFDPTCEGDIAKASFAIFKFESSKAQLEMDGKYQNLDNIRPEANSVLAEPDYNISEDVRSFTFKDEPRKKFVVHEYWGEWDINGDGTTKPIVAAWVGNTLIRMEENPYPDKKIPFVVARYLPTKRSIYGEPDGELLKDNQKVIGAVTRGMIDVMAKSANGQTGIRKDMLDPTNRRKYEKGMDYEFNPQVDPRQGVYMHTFAEIPNSAQFMLQLQSFEAESLTGVKSFSSGVNSSSLGEVAAGIRGALDAASKREMTILRRLSKAIVEVGRKFISMNSAFLEEEEVIRITNEEFQLIKRDDLSGSFDLKLDISTAEEDAAKAQELAFMLQTMGNNMDPGMTKLILSDIARLRKMPDLAKRIENFEPQPDPMAEKIRELELQLLQAKVQNEFAHAEGRNAQSQLDSARIGTEHAKQATIGAQKDQADLDFVEQESGVKQQRDLQLRAEQAKSQAQLKTLDNAQKDKQQDKQIEVDLLKEYLKTKTKTK